MAFCRQCGTKIGDKDAFCNVCGAPTGVKSEKREETREKRLEKTKCPNCGELIEAYELKCPACGFELRNIEATKSVKDLANKVQEIEKGREKGNPIVSMFTDELVVGKVDSEIANVIQSAPIPNTIEDIIEFMIMASSNINPAAFTNYNTSEYGVISQGERAKSKAWESKMDQAYRKARLSFSNNLKFENVQQIYDETHKKIHDVQRNAKKKFWSLMAGLIIMLFVVFGLMIGMGVVFSQHDEKMIESGAIAPSYSSRDFKGMEYEEVVEILSNDGFSNITAKAVKGSFVDGLETGQVIKVTIDGTYCTEGSYESPNAPVLVEYKK